MRRSRPAGVRWVDVVSIGGVVSLYSLAVNDDAMAGLLRDVADAIGSRLVEGQGTHLTSPREPGERPGQFRLDLIAEEIALPYFEQAGLSVLSEEVGLIDRGGELIVIMDPVDGSTNASRGIPWFATSLCVMDDAGPRLSLVVNLVTGRRYEARRGGGAFRDGAAITPSNVTDLSSSMVVINGFDPGFTRWLQYRSLGATALDLCCVGDGTADASIDFSGALGPWDYLGAALVLTEVGAVIEDSHGRNLFEVGHDVRRQPIAAANRSLLDQIRRVRAEAD